MSRSGRIMPSASSCVCSMPPATRKSCGSTCRAAPAMSFTDSCRRRRPGWSMACARTALMPRMTGTASIRTSCCSTLMHAIWSANSSGMTRCWDIKPIIPRVATHSIIATAHPSCRSAGWPVRSEGLPTACPRPLAPGARRCSTRCMYAATASSIRALPASCAARLPAWPNRPRLRISSAWASPRSSCCRWQPGSMSCTSRSAASPITGATTRSRFLRCSLRLPGRVACRPWSMPSNGCMAPASRSFWMWSSTTPGKGMSAARRCLCAASTMPPITSPIRTGPGAIAI